MGPRGTCGLKGDPRRAAELINHEGEVVLMRPRDVAREDDRFERLRGTADVKWRTDELMALLRGDD